jgi:hypothetical protein
MLNVTPVYLVLAEMFLKRERSYEPQVYGPLSARRRDVIQCNAIEVTRVGVTVDRDIIGRGDGWHDRSLRVGRRRFQG